ncbi:MAG: hypothetical protein ACRC2V_00505 [Xenococcaceae cyanobacterium]
MDFYTKTHQQLHQKKNLQATLCGAVTIAGFIGFMAIPSQAKKIDYLKLAAIATSFLSCPVGMAIVHSKKNLDGKAALMEQVSYDKLGAQVAADVAIDNEETRIRMEERLAAIVQERGGNP